MLRTLLQDLLFQLAANFGHLAYRRLRTVAQASSIRRNYRSRQEKRHPD
jgi:hypothetical protein